MRYAMLVLFLLLAVFPVLGQDEVAECDPNAIAEDLTVQMALLEDDTVNALFAMLEVVMRNLGDCTGQNYHFTSEEEGRNTVLGPLEMTEGIYIITLTTDSMATVSPTAVGSCGFDLELTLFAEFGSGFADGAQKVVEIESDCGVLWEFANMADDWTFDIEKTG